MTDPGMDNLVRDLAAAKAHTLVRDERYFWDHRAEHPEAKVTVFPGPERWKAAALAQCELCPGCEVKLEHYHEKIGGDAL